LWDAAGRESDRREERAHLNLGGPVGEEGGQPAQGQVRDPKTIAEPADEGGVVDRVEGRREIQ
jgi:hypothetical protein